MLDAGFQIGPYQIESLVGAGGMGEVYRARDRRLARTVALKILPPQVAADTGRRQRFEQEARAASGLNHPNIVSVFDIGEQDGLAYIVSELIDGESLRDIIRRSPLPPSRVADLMSQTADALATAHAAGIVHRDLKPENIMVTRDGRAKVLDFGLAKQAVAAAPASDETRTMVAHTSPGTVLGTAAYMSPEQVRGGAIDHRSDIFSLGLVIFECASGRQPFERTTAVETMTAILREDPAELPETAPPALREIVWHCLEKEPERRFQSARDLAFALRTLSAPSRPSGISKMAPAVPARGWKWLWPSLAGVVGAALVLLAVSRALAPDSGDLAPYRFTPFATGGDPQSAGAWSPDEKSIAYVKSIGGIPQLMVREINSPAPVQLTHSADPVAQPFWAPDSSLLYYVTQGGSGAVWAISPAGGRASRIITGLYAAAISPDGKALAIWEAHTEGANLRVRGSVLISSPPGAGPKRYTPEPFGGAEPGSADRIAFSPDGSSILLLTGLNASELWLLPYPAGGAPPRRLFAKTDLGVSPAISWMPGSGHAVLAFGTGIGAAHSLWMADLKHEHLRRISAGTLSHDDPSVAPDGRSLVFTTALHDYDLVSLPLDGGAPARIVENSRDEFSPSWSPQGDQIIYATDRSGQSEIWIHNLKAGIDRPIVTPRDFPRGTTTALADPVFSPDGSRFAFLRYSTDEPVAIWFEPAVGGAPIRLAPEQIQSPVWSPDGNSIAGLVKRDNPWQPAVVGVGANMSAHLVPNAPFCRTALAWSPAGNWLACETYDRIALFTRDGSGSARLPKLNASALAFSRDGKTLYAAGRERGRAFLKAIDVASGSVRLVADYGTDFTISGGLRFHTRLSLAPDGKSLATSVVTSKSDLWLLEGYPLPRPWWQIWR